MKQTLIWLALSILLSEFSYSQIKSTGCGDLGDLYVDGKEYGPVRNVKLIIDTIDTIGIKLEVKRGSSCMCSIKSFTRFGVPVKLYNLHSKYGEYEASFEFIGEPGAYILKGDLDCRNEIAIYIDFTGYIGLTEVEDDIKSSPFPNPFSDFIEVPSDNFNPLQRVEIRNLNGVLVYSIDRFTESNLVLNLGNLESGVYIFRRIGAEFVTSHRIVKL